jgi:membrane-bound lytic murein transglycosylase D
MEKQLPMNPIIHTGLLCLAITLLSACSTVPHLAQATHPATETTSTTAPGAPAASGAVSAENPLKPLVVGAGQGNPVAEISAPTDVWERVRRGFGMPDLDVDLVSSQEQWYMQRPDYIVRMTERSRKYAFHITEELERRRMPSELALLPFVESAFVPGAVSRAGAAGMWQFMPATGKQYELRQNMFRDDRRDVLASTRAALDYLQRLYGLFNDWHLALAAYNWGEGNVGRAIARNQKAGLPTGYADLNMPMETRMYVPKLQAIKNIIRDPQRFNAKLPTIANHPYFQTIELTRDIDVSVAAQLADIAVDEFRSLNPSANRPVILASGTPQILLPWDNADTFVRNLQTYPHRLATWTAWIAPRTMKTAEAAKQTGMSETELRNANHIPPRMLVKAGSVLLVHRHRADTPNVAEKIADNAHLALTPEIVMKRISVKAKKNETLADIARKNGSALTAALELNKLNASTHLKPGQIVLLDIPVKASSRTAKVSTTSRQKTAVKGTANKPAVLARR